jgi:sugar phosphate isomerase/epimerase
MSRLIDRNKRDMQMIEGGGAGASGGLRYKRGEASKRDTGAREVVEIAKAIGAPAVAGLGAIAGGAYADKRKAEAEGKRRATETKATRFLADESARHYKGVSNATKQK